MMMSKAVAVVLLFAALLVATRLPGSADSSLASGPPTPEPYLVRSGEAVLSVNGAAQMQSDPDEVIFDVIVAGPLRTEPTGIPGASVALVRAGVSASNILSSPPNGMVENDRAGIMHLYVVLSPATAQTYTAMLSRIHSAAQSTLIEASGILLIRNACPADQPVISQFDDATKRRAQLIANALGLAVGQRLASDQRRLPAPYSNAQVACGVQQRVTFENMDHRGFPPALPKYFTRITGGALYRLAGAMVTGSVGLAAPNVKWQGIAGDPSPELLPSYRLTFDRSLRYVQTDATFAFSVKDQVQVDECHQRQQSAITVAAAAASFRIQTIAAAMRERVGKLISIEDRGQYADSTCSGDADGTQGPELFVSRLRVAYSFADGKVHNAANARDAYYGVGSASYPPDPSFRQCWNASLTALRLAGADLERELGGIRPRAIVGSDRGWVDYGDCTTSFLGGQRAPDSFARYTQTALDAYTR